MKKTLRFRLIEERKGHRWSQLEVANLLGTTQQNVSRWERGLTTPDPYFRAKLSELFGISPQELGVMTEHPSPTLTAGRNKGEEERIPSASLTQETSSQKRDHSDRGILLSRLRWDYQKDLDTSLERLAWQELGLAEQPTIVRNAAFLSQRRPDQTERPLPAGTSILQVYDDSARALLLLGKPGAGKSTLLTRLALGLVERAEAEATHPLPVIVSLSSWAQHQASLEQWLVEQFADRYALPRLIGTRWLQQNQFIVLLDGLDEMDEAARPRCIAAINAFRRTSLSPLVVCSRTTEYHNAAVRQRLILQNAVMVQPLTKAQIAAALQRGGDALALLRDALTTSTLRH